MLDIVAGISLKNLKPKVWDKTSPYYLSDLEAIMVSYADFHAMPYKRKMAMEQGLHAYLDVPRQVKIYLDNGSFYFMSRSGNPFTTEYEEFVKAARPDWYPIPRDFIPTPKMGRVEQESCFDRTMDINRTYDYDGYVPVVHISGFLQQYASAIKASKRLSAKPSLALGGIVPNLLRTQKAMPLTDVLTHLRFVRDEFKSKQLHVFGIGGTATIHIAALLRMDSIDSSGWRNRAARGIIQLFGSGDRMIADLGKWRGRKPSRGEWKKLRECQCPACTQFGVKGLKDGGIEGFCNRACHNFWVLLEEAKWIKEQFAAKTYVDTYKNRLDNSIYLPLIESIIDIIKGSK
jgi:7-cyano-7-deazaguanine tRNA-ribosyltransferase